MNRTLRALIPMAGLLCLATPLKADVTMRLTGKVTTKDGTPVAGAKVIIHKIDTGWRREVETDAKGVYSQAGLAPDRDPHYELTVSKDGFATLTTRVAVPLVGSSITKDLTLYLPSEAPPDASQPAATAPPADPAAKEDADARAAFNAAIPLYNAKQYAEALPNLEKAYKGMSDAIATMKDEAAKADSQALLPSISKAYGLALHEAGKDDEAIPLLSQLVDADPKNAKNADAMKALVDIYKGKKDSANLAKYQAALNAAAGISGAEAPYAAAANAFNAGHMKEAKSHLQKAIAADANYPDSYYLMGLVSLNEGNLAAAKSNFHKYLELAPNGKKAGEVKEMLAGL